MLVPGRISLAHFRKKITSTHWQLFDDDNQERGEIIRPYRK